MLANEKLSSDIKCCIDFCNCSASCCDESILTLDNFVDIIKQKWTLKIISALYGKEKGFNELLYSLGTCTRKVLTEQLNVLITKGIVKKTISKVNNVPHSSYSLTSVGYEFIDLLKQIKAFGCKYLNE